MNWVQTGFAARNYPVLTVRRTEIEYESVPPGEAAQFVSIARIAAAQRSQA
jgi:hypothetical protein